MFSPSKVSIIDLNTDDSLLSYTEFSLNPKRNLKLDQWFLFFVVLTPSLHFFIPLQFLIISFILSLRAYLFCLLSIGFLTTSYSDLIYLLLFFFSFSSDHSF